MTWDWFDSLMLGMVSAMLLYWGLQYEPDTYDPVACAVAEKDYKGNSLCYQDSSCMITGADFRLQIHTAEYLKENCPDEWEAVQIATKVTGTEEANPGFSVWSRAKEQTEWGQVLRVPPTDQPADEPVSQRETSHN